MQNFEVKSNPVIITSQPSKTNNSCNGDRKWIKYSLRKRNAGKCYKLAGLSLLVENLKFFRGLNQNLKFFSSENCNRSGVLDKLIQLKRITDGGHHQSIFVFFRKNSSLFNAIWITFYTVLEPFEKTNIRTSFERVKLPSAPASLLPLLLTGQQRWCRGHKVRGQGQGHKKIRGQGQGQPFRGQIVSSSRTGMLENKAKDQGHSRKRPQKKGLQKFFFRLSPKKTVKKKNFQPICKILTIQKNTAVPKRRTGKF